MTYIYLVENCYGNPNNIYIGKTKGDWRKRQHEKRFGSKTVFTIIDEVNSLEWDEWSPIETYWIHQFKQWGFELMNVRYSGGNGVGEHSEETKQKMRRPHKSTGKQTPEHILKRTQQKNKPVLQLSRDGKLIQEWPSSTIAAQSLNIGQKGINHCCNYKQPTAYNFIWRFKDNLASQDIIVYY
jgi:hypothetical protein